MSDITMLQIHHPSVVHKTPINTLTPRPSAPFPYVLVCGIWARRRGFYLKVFEGARLQAFDAIRLCRSIGTDTNGMSQGGFHCCVVLVRFLQIHPAVWQTGSEGILCNSRRLTLRRHFLCLPRLVHGQHDTPRCKPCKTICSS
jgi:hypothetical protein